MHPPIPSSSQANQVSTYLAEMAEFKQECDDLRRQEYPDMLYVDLTSKVIRRLYWPTLDHENKYPLPFERFNDHHRTHAFYDIGCFCILLFNVPATISVFKVKKAGEWQDTWVAGCGTYKTNPESSCGLWTPLGHNSLPLMDRLYFTKARFYGGVPYHYYPPLTEFFDPEDVPYYAYPLAPPKPLPTAPSPPKLLTTGEPGSALYGAMGGLLGSASASNSNTRIGPVYRTPVKKEPIKAKGPARLSATPSSPKGDVFVTPYTGATTKGYLQNRKGLIMGPTTKLEMPDPAYGLTPPDAVPVLSAVATGRVTHAMGHSGFEAAHTQRTENACYRKPYDDSARVSAHSKGKAVVRPISKEPHQIFARLQDPAGFGIDRMELELTLWTCPRCGKLFVAFLRDLHLEACNQIIEIIDSD